jgi:hypothetical protein
MDNKGDFFYQCCFPFYPECQWHYSVNAALPKAHATSILRWAVTAGEDFLRLGVLSGLPPPFFSWFASCDLWRVRFLVAPFPPCGPPLLGSLLAWTSVLAPCFLFSPFLGCFFYNKVWQGFIVNLATHYVTLQIKMRWRNLAITCDPTN